MIRFKLFGFPVSVHWMFWLIMAMLGGGLHVSGPEGLQRVVIWVAVGFVSILWHELGHAFFQRKYGAAEPQIMLYGGGGLAMPGPARFTRGQDIIISLMGPIFGFSLGILAWVAKSYLPISNPIIGDVIGGLLWINFFWTALNLLPILPLDGGRVFDAVLNYRHRKFVAWTGVILSAAVAFCLFYFFRSMFGALMFGMFAFSNFQRAQGQQPQDMLGGMPR